MCLAMSNAISLCTSPAAVEMMESVRDRYPRLVTPSIFAAVQRGLLARKRGTVEHLHPDHLLPRVARGLRRLAKAMPRRIRRVGGSTSVRAMWKPLRHAGAAARITAVWPR